MTKFNETYYSNHSVEQLYSLIIDVESYPEFLPWCSNAKIIDKTDAQLIADLTLKFKIFNESYRSQIILTPPEKDFAKVEVSAISGPFKYLENTWTLTKVGDQNVINFSIDFEFNSPLLNKIIGTFFTLACQNMMEAFEKRAKELFG